MSTVSKHGVWLAIVLAAFTYYLGQQSGRAERSEAVMSAVNDALSQCQMSGGWLMCPSHIRAVAATQ